MSNHIRGLVTLTDSLQGYFLDIYYCPFVHDIALKSERRHILYKKKYLIVSDFYDAGNDSINTFCDKVMHLIEESGWDYSDFEEETLHNRNFFYQIKQRNLANPKLETVIAICIGLRVKPYTTEELLRLSGHILRNTKEHSVYKMLISSCYNKGIDYVNETLEYHGIKAFGSGERK